MNTKDYLLKAGFLTVAMLLAYVQLSAQKWAEMIHDGKANFYEIQATFESEWSGNEHVRGSGWKPYKRWEHYTEERVFPSGELPPQHLRFQEYYKFMSIKNRGSVNSSRSNGNWESIGPFSWQEDGGWNPGIGRVNFITEEPGNPSTIYVGTPSGGLWRSEDAGSSWTPLTDEIPSMGVSGIAVDPHNTNIIYIATGDRDANDYQGVGVLKSTDYGATWQTTGIGWNLSDGIKSNWLIMHPDDNETLYLATNIGLYKTTNAAESWQLIQNTNIREVALHPSNPDIVYAVSNRFYRSEDGGNSFQQINEGLPPASEVNRYSLTVSPAAPDHVYLLAGDDETSGFRGLYRSTDAGFTFEERADSPNIMGYSSSGNSSGGQSWFDIALAANPGNGERIVTGGINVWRSNTGGITYSPLSHWVYPSDIGYTHADIHFLRYFDDRLYCGSDGGIFISTDEGANWTDLSEGLQITQTYRMAFSEQEPYRILAGTQDNGTNFLNNGTFEHILGGDGNGAAVNSENPNIVYAAYPNGNITKSTDGGLNFSGITGDVEENGAWVTPFMLDPSDQNTLYAGFQSIWKYNESNGWENIGSFGGGTFRALAVAASDNNYIYASKGGLLYRTSDGGENWTTNTSGLPGTSITDIVVSQNNPEHLIITCSGYSAGNKVYVSNDGGATVENITYNLPNIPATSVVFENSGYNGIYVGTDAGVYYTNDSLANWIDYMEGLPKTIARQLLMSESIGKIRVATYGRGFWESDLYTPGTEPPVAAFETNLNVICAGDSIQFTDLSYNAAPGWSWTFDGGSPAVSGERNPVVYFFEEGVYSVTLTVQNANGEDVAIQNEYIVVLGPGEAAPYSESFESFDDLFTNKWITENPDEDVTWELTEEVGFESNQSIFIPNLENPTGRIDRIVSPTIDLTGVGAATLTFKVAYAQRNELNDDKLRVYISNDCGQGWALRGQWKGTTNLPTAPPSEQAFIPQNAEEWQLIEVDNINDNYFGEGFRFMFYFENDNGNNIYIDDINLITSLVGIDDQENWLESAELFPNPARGFTYLDFSIPQRAQVSYTIYDIRGALITEKSLGELSAGEHRETIHTYDYPSGVYLVKLTTDSQQITRKLFIE